MPVEEIFQKDPSAVLDYPFDWSEWLATGETISDHTMTLDSGLTLNSSGVCTGVVTPWISGGTAGNRYAVACKISTNLGRTDERTITIEVLNR